MMTTVTGYEVRDCEEWIMNFCVRYWEEKHCIADKVRPLPALWCGRVCICSGGSSAVPFLVSLIKRGVPILSDWC